MLKYSFLLILISSPAFAQTMDSTPIVLSENDVAQLDRLALRAKALDLSVRSGQISKSAIDLQNVLTKAESPDDSPPKISVNSNLDEVCEQTLSDSCPLTGLDNVGIYHHTTRAALSTNKKFGVAYTLPANTVGEESHLQFALAASSNKDSLSQGGPLSDRKKSFNAGIYWHIQWGAAKATNTRSSGSR